MNLMASLKITICFWYLDPLVVDDVLNTLRKGKIDVSHSHCKERSVLHARLNEDPPDLIISDFDSPEKSRKIVEQEMEPYYTEVPLIYLVGE